MPRELRGLLPGEPSGLRQPQGTQLAPQLIVANNAIHPGRDRFDIERVDWERGVIARNREKTGVESQHKLWPLTLKMLRAQAGSGPLLLTAGNGQPLLYERIEDGEPSKTDTIGRTFNALKKKKGISLSFKYLRKTGANGIAKQFQDKPWLVELFLAHKDQRMRKHYTQHYDELHKAIEWLSGHFGLEPATRN